MPNPIAEGTFTTDGTDKTIYAGTTNRVTQLFVNMDNSTSAEIIVVSEKMKVLTGDSVALLKKTTLTGKDGGLPNGALIFQTDPLSSPYGVTYTMQNTLGANLTYKYRIDEL